MSNDRVQHFLRVAATRSDLVIVSMMVTIIMLMILPLPTFLVDFLIATNMSLTVLTLMAALYLRRSVDFSTLPTVILVLTVFRLSLSITTTRLVLLQADAGEIIRTFGEFVIAGNLVVGLVVFMIITVVQFIVITKGSERVAEVAARFTLDGMPGKQMSIDNDLRNGDIDKIEARRRRSLLERESQLYGAMDGVMKFVKGDAVAGLIIVAVNLIGGIAVGSIQHGMSFGEAGQVYSLLTVGDGLVSQIPALFVSITAGTIVTRVSNEEASNLGAEVVGQLGANTTALKLAGLIVAGMALVPGFPVATFLLLAAGLGGAGFGLDRLKRRAASAEGSEEQQRAGTAQRGVAELSGQSSANVVAVIPPNLGEVIDRGRLQEHIRKVRGSLFEDLGLEFPLARLVIDETVAKDRYRVDLDGVPIADGQIRSGWVLLRDEPAHAELADAPYERGPSLFGQRDTYWIEAGNVPRLVDAGIGYMETGEVLAMAIGDALTRRAASFVGIQETRALLGRMERDYGDLVREASRIVPLQKMAEVLRRLLDEGVSIRNLRVVLEALVEWGPKEQDVVLLAEYVRSAMKRQICFRYANKERVLAAYIIERDAEEAVRGAVRQTAVGSYLALPDNVAVAIVDAIRAQLAAVSDPSVRPVVLASLDVRRFVRSLLQKNSVNLPVLSYQDLAPEFTVQPIGSVKLALKAA